MIRILIVDDSLVQQELLTYIFSADPDIKVIGTATDGEEAIRKVVDLKPDLVTMDINMPRMNGITAIREIMSIHPLPIVVISGNFTKTEVSNSIQAMEAGAVWVIENATFTPQSTKTLLNTIKLMSEIKVVKRHVRFDNKAKKSPKDSLPLLANIKVIAIGASIGGPITLQHIFKNLTNDFPPILVVQHISTGFLQGLTDWFLQSSNLSIKIANDNEDLIRNHIYIAPDGYQMGVNSSNKIMLKPDQAINGHRPSVTYLFRSIAQNIGKPSLGILLTGMGNDGADGLKEMKEAGSMTIVQDEESSIVYGMPKEALALGASSTIMTPIEIAHYINALSIKKI